MLQEMEEKKQLKNVWQLRYKVDHKQSNATEKKTNFSTKKKTRNSIETCKKHKLINIDAQRRHISSVKKKCIANS